MSATFANALLAASTFAPVDEVEKTIRETLIDRFVDRLVQVSAF